MPAIDTNRKVTPEELAEHTGDNDLWVAFHGLVYDLSKWVAAHPGGKTVLKDAAGKDATKNFEMIHGGKGPLILLANENNSTVTLIGEYDAPLEEEAPETIEKEFIDETEESYEFTVKGAVEFEEEIEVNRSQVVKVTATGPAATLWISGQCAPEAALDQPIKEQADAALNVMREELEKGGAKLEDVVKVNAYIVDLDSEKVSGVARAVAGAFRPMTAAMTWVGTTALADPKALVEIEAVAVVSARAKL